MGKESYDGLNPEQLEQLQAFDKNTRSSAAKLGLVRRAIRQEASGSQWRNETEQLMAIKYREFFKLFSRLSTESQEALIEKALNFNLKPDTTETEFLELMADLNRYAISLAPKDDPEGEKKPKPKWQEELTDVVDEMQRLKEERKVKNKLKQQEGQKEKSRVN